MKNGCCRECMKAFSKTGKVSSALLSCKLIQIIEFICPLILELPLPSAKDAETGHFASKWLQNLQLQGVQSD